MTIITRHQNIPFSPAVYGHPSGKAGEKIVGTECVYQVLTLACRGESRMETYSSRKPMCLRCKPDTTMRPIPTQDNSTIFNAISVGWGPDQRLTIHPTPTRPQLYVASCNSGGGGMHPISRSAFIPNLVVERSTFTFLHMDRDVCVFARSNRECVWPTCEWAVRLDKPPTETAAIQVQTGRLRSVPC